ncbi:kinase-like protein [Lepidopterella palustris CBS 459.81]|uniref:Kinase-like protein n=1 Tax=Lepidopterella palustris CBS 459.81 TaxID=1314670 RepID=A0A8E2EHF9_9PEZI|nr:kinase-like protein [Lepidopterella palustris CBS 459.81]
MAHQGGRIVAYLEVRISESDGKENLSQISIRGNEEFYLGRNSQYCRYHWHDGSISNKHLRIHCLLYEQNFDSEIPPLVYATDLSTNGTFLKKKDDHLSKTQTPRQGNLLGRKAGAYLLDDGDELHISNSIRLIYHSLVPSPRDKLSFLQEQETQHFQLRYRITNRALGVGGYGKVFVAIHQKTRRQLACKVVDLSHIYAKMGANGLRPSIDQSSSHSGTTIPGGATNIGSSALHRGRWPKKVKQSFREFDILKDLSHPNVITIEKVFWSYRSLYIFEELVTGGDLFSYIEYKGGFLCDIEAALVMRQILKAVEYLHEHDIVHRDLKPDNILMTSLADGARIIVTDFGNARYIPSASAAEGQTKPPTKRMFTMVGTLDYAAPEIYKRNTTIPADQGYSKSIDMWSIGTITTALLTGDVIFNDRNHADWEYNSHEIILGLSSACDISILDSRPAWQKISHRPKDFIKNLLVLDETLRMTASQALAHPWFTNEYHAAEFEALYNRAVKDWQPRRKVFRVVEPIVFNTTSSLSDDGLPKGLLRNEVVSKYFAPPRQIPSELILLNTQDSSLSRRPNTPLPTIQEELETFDRGRSISPPFIHCSDSPGMVDDLHGIDLGVAVDFPPKVAECNISSIGSPLESMMLNQNVPRQLSEMDIDKSEPDAFTRESNGSNLKAPQVTHIQPIFPKTPIRATKRPASAYDDLAQLGTDDHASQGGDDYDLDSAQHAQVLKRRKLH